MLGVEELQALLNRLEPLLRAATLLELPRLFAMAEWLAKQVRKEDLLRQQQKKTPCLSSFPGVAGVAGWLAEVLWVVMHASSCLRR